MKDRNKNNEGDDRTIVTHGTGVYDVTQFADIHPGGRRYFDTFNKKVLKGSNLRCMNIKISNLGYYRCYGWKNTSAWAVCHEVDGAVSRGLCKRLSKSRNS